MKTILCSPMCTKAVIVCALILGRKYRKYSLPLQTSHLVSQGAGSTQLNCNTQVREDNPVLNYINWLVPCYCEYKINKHEVTLMNP